MVKARYQIGSRSGRKLNLMTGKRCRKRSKIEEVLNFN